jgi:anti-sigma B factor antagonist
MAAPVTAVIPGGPAGPAESVAAPCEAAAFMAGGAAPSSGSAASPVGAHVIPDLSWKDAAQLPALSTRRRDDVAVVSLSGELDLLGAPVLQAHLSDIRWLARARSVVDLTGLAFIDCSCLSVLVRCCKEIRGRGASFALAGPQPAVLRILSVTGLLTWFEVYGTVEEAVTGAGMQQSPALHGTPCPAQAPGRARGRDPGDRSSTRAGARPVTAETGVTNPSRSGSART